jgi:hypothetical protein
MSVAHSIFRGWPDGPNVRPQPPLVLRRADLPAQDLRRTLRWRAVNVRWLCLRPPDQLEEYELAALQDILDGYERLVLGYALLQRFRRVIARLSVRDPDHWLDDPEASELRPFVGFSHEFRRIAPQWS